MILTVNEPLEKDHNYDFDGVYGKMMVEIDQNCWKRVSLLQYNIKWYIQTSQELQMLYSVTLNCQVTKI